MQTIYVSKKHQPTPMTVYCPYRYLHLLTIPFSINIPISLLSSLPLSLLSSRLPHLGLCWLSIPSHQILTILSAVAGPLSPPPFSTSVVVWDIASMCPQSWNWHCGRQRIASLTASRGCSGRGQVSLRFGDGHLLCVFRLWWWTCMAFEVRWKIVARVDSPWSGGILRCW